VTAVVAEKRPAGREWTEVGPFRIRAPGRPTLELGTVWKSGPITVISQLEEMQLPGSSNAVGPTWHISVSSDGKRPKPHHVRRALRAFGMVGAEVDNHHPGSAVHYFMPVAKEFRGICECKSTEVQVREADGYTWSQPIGGPCRVCELEKLIGEIGGRANPCPVHGAKERSGR
jgi:hypothetical protein